MMFDWNAYQQQLTTTIKDISQLSPGTVRGYAELGNAGQKQVTSKPKCENSSPLLWQ